MTRKLKCVFRVRTRTQTKTRLLSFLVVVVLMAFKTSKVALAAGDNVSTGTEDLSMTFLKIIKCVGKVSFIFGYLEFTDAMGMGDGAHYLKPIKKMCCGIVLCCVPYFLSLVGAYQAIANGTEVSNINRVCSMINNIISVIVASYGAIVAGKGFSALGTSISARDIVQFKKGVMLTLSGVCAGAASLVAIFVGI